MVFDVDYNNIGAIKVSFHYSQRIVEAIKGWVPATYRYYDAATRTWSIHVLAQEHFRHFLYETGYGNEVPLVDQLFSKAASTNMYAPSLTTERFITFMPVKDRGTERTSYTPATSGVMCVFTEEVLRQYLEVNSVPAKKIALDTSTFYTVLSVAPKATTDEIRAQFKKLAFGLHPDRNSDPDAADAFIVVKEAHDILVDPVRRKKYDFAIAVAPPVVRKNTSSSGKPYGWIHESNAKVVYSPPIAPCIIEFLAYDIFGKLYATHIHGISPFTNIRYPTP